MAGLNLFTNNASTTLASNVLIGATSLTVATGYGSLFPALAGSQYFYCTLTNAAATIVEIVKVTARVSDTFTIVRGQDNTSAQAWNAGDKVELRLTAADLQNFPQLDSTNTFSQTQTFVTPILGTPTSATLTNATGLPLTTGVTGTLPIANGGTGSTSTTFVNAATNITGTLPVANGGTGTATPSLVSGTNITISGSWPNQTVTAAGGGVTSLNGQTGAITNTSQYAIGSYVNGRPQNGTVYAVNSTLAGSSIYATSTSLQYEYAAGQWRTFTNGTSLSGGTTLVNTGTWRCMSPAGTSPGDQIGIPGLWVRIS